MKFKKIYIILAIIPIFIVFYFFMYYFFSFGSTASTGTVIEKNIEHSYIIFQEISGEQTKVKVPKATINLIEENQEYFVIYYYNKFREPFLVNIEK